MTTTQPVQRATLPPINVDVALQWAQAGWKFFPCVDDPDKPGKLKPSVSGWQLPNGPATNDAEQIRAWCRDPSVRALAIPTGCAFGIAGLDIDEKSGHSGSASLAAAGHAIPPDALQWETRSGGKHILFTYPTDGRTVPVDASVLADGVDRRGDGGHLYFWPANGFPYTLGVMPPAPEWFTVAPRNAANDATPPERVGLTDEQLREFANRIDASQFDSYDAWVRIGMALHHETAGSHLGRELFDQISRRAPKYGENGPNLLDSKWRSFGDHRARVTLRSFIGQTPDIAAEAGSAERLREWFSGEPATLPTPSATNTPPAPTVAPDQIGALRACDRLGRSWLSASAIDDDGSSEPAEIVENLLPAGALACCFGGPGCGKTFAMMDLAFAIAEGRPFLGQRTIPGHVLYIAAEAPGVARDRVRAYRKHAQTTLPRFHILQCAINLLDATEVKGLLALIEQKRGAIGEPLAAVFIDTVARSMPGGNENQADDMGLVVNAGYAIKGPDARTAVIFVHHSGKDPTRGARGSNALLGAVDSEYQIDKDPNTKIHTLTVTKMRTGAEGRSWSYRIQPVPLRTNQWNEPVTSAVVVPMGEQDETHAPRKPVSGKQNIQVMRGVRDTINLHGRNPGRMHDHVTADEVRAEFDRCNGHMSAKSRSNAFNRSLTALLADKHVNQIGEWISLPVQRMTTQQMFGDSSNSSFFPKEEE